MPPAVLVRPSRGAGVVRLVLQAGASVGGTAWVMGYASGSTALVSLAPFAGAAALGSMLPATGLLARPVLGVRTRHARLALTFDDGPDPTWTPRVLDLLERTRHARLALTFDDGPDPTWTPRVLDLLEAHGQRGTFFVIGARAAAHPALLRAVVARGHELANHTWAHGYGTAFVPPRSLARELRRVDDLLEAEVGVRSRWFRPPVGVVSPWVARGAAGARLTLVTWSAAA
ncbi:MAG: polysaccharide deacetylase family protein, partial [Gemmatimonadaceae bacterium]|nr:polysaccharide deacetylase family protein [Gemmatimonadaceae bacterium]